jgi:hypothetical protein
MPSDDGAGVKKCCRRWRLFFSWSAAGGKITSAHAAETK